MLFCTCKIVIVKVNSFKKKILVQRLPFPLQNFEHGNKSSRFVVNQLKIKEEKTNICAINYLF